MFEDNAAAMAAALLLDAALGDPVWLPHPVVGFGALIRSLEKKLRRPGDAPRIQFLKGVLLLAALFAAALVPALFLMTIAKGSLKFSLKVLLFWLAIALNTMTKEAQAVQRALEEGPITRARGQIARIVGRDTRELSPQGVARACIESVAESTSDGVIAPMFFGLFFGPAGAMAYKAVNTLDSMVGYNDERYRFFGRPSARADDLLNLIPARVTGILAALLAGFSGGRVPLALSVYRRDRHNHASPNSGHPEAAFAGALEVELGGPSSYGGQMEKKPYFNAGAPLPFAGDIARSIRLMQVVTLAFLGLAGLIIFITGGIR